CKLWSGKCRRNAPAKLWLGSRIINRPFRQCETGRVDDRGVLIFRLFARIDRQYEARAISALSLPIDIGPNNRIGLVVSVSPAAECRDRLRATRQGHPG